MMNVFFLQRTVCAVQFRKKFGADQRETVLRYLISVKEPKFNKYFCPRTSSCSPSDTQKAEKNVAILKSP